MPTLPPAVRDPSTGKTFIAIAAPSFIFAPSSESTPSKEAKEDSHALSKFLYIERPPLADFSRRRVFATAYDSVMKEAPSVEIWMAGLTCAESPPPGHTPWEGYAKDLSPSSSLSSLTKKRPPIPRFRFTRCSALLASKSDSSFEIPLGECGSALLEGSLPSTSSSAWSGGLSLPHISKILDVEGPPAVIPAPSIAPAPAPAPVLSPELTATSGPVSSPALPFIRPLQPRKKSGIPPDNLSRREAHVMDRRQTIEKAEKIPAELCTPPANKPSLVNDMLSDIEAFLSDGLTKMDNNMQQLGFEKGKLRSPATPTTPSLVISNSTQVLPLELEAIQSTPPLAIRRGKKVPGQIQVRPCLTAFEYPSVPTAFRGSPGPGSPCFSSEPVYPELTLDMTMSTEEMISSLRAQVESFKPQEPSAGHLKEHCDNAFKWFNSEMALDSPSSPLETLVESLSRSNCDSLSPSPVIGTPPDEIRPPASPTDSIRLTKMRASVTLSGRNNSILEGKDIKLPSENLRDWNAIRTKPRAATISGGTPVLEDRKVRFSALPPDVIPEDILEKKTEGQAKNAAERKHKTASGLSPNKPVFRQFTQVRRTPTPTKNSIPVVSGRARAMSTGSTLVGSPQRKKLPPSPLSQTTPMTLRPLSLIGKRGKENKSLKVAGITFLKRKSIALVEEGGEGKFERVRNSPLLNVLNRLRG